MSGRGRLREAFLSALAETDRPAFAGDDALELRLRALLEGAGAASDGQDTRFVEHVARVVPQGSSAALLDELRAADLYLAWACSQGDARALAAFERSFGKDIEVALARAGAGSTRDELRQALRHKLFVARPGRGPKIADYGGRGDLRSWVRVAALRLGVDFVRRRAADREIPVDDGVLGGLVARQEDPELDHLRRTHAAALREALSLAFARLTARERNLLRHQVLHGLNIDQVGALYRVHRTTAFRWVEKARQALLRETRRALRERLAVGEAELVSIIRAVGGDLDVSVRRLLVSDLEDEPAGG